MKHHCGVCHEITLNQDWCDKCLRHSEEMRAEIQRRKAEKQKRREDDRVAKAKFMAYDRDECKFVLLKSNNIVKAIHTAWNYEFPVYERDTEECIFDGFSDNEDNNEILKDYDLRIIDHEGLRRLQTISTGEIHKAPWERT